MTAGTPLCLICGYDEKGNRVLSGRDDLGNGFVGESTRVTYDDFGRVRERISVNEKGQIVRRLVNGRFGPTDVSSYDRGVLQSRDLFRYSPDGLRRVVSFFDASGVQTGKSIIERDPEGNITEVWSFGRRNAFLSHYTDILDSKAGVETSTRFNGNGTTLVSWTAHKNEVISYWQDASEKSEPFSRICFEIDTREEKCELHYPDGSFTQTLGVFSDDEKHFLSHVEFRDAHQQVQETEDYEYEFDSHGNWTRCAEWVWTVLLREKKLIGVQSRTLNYWK